MIATPILIRRTLSRRALVNAMLREGLIVKLDNDREGGPFYRQNTR
jgi:hypothetical protein